MVKGYKYNIGDRIQDDKRDMTIISREKRKQNNGCIATSYQIKCNKCGFHSQEHYYKGILKNEYWITESHLLRGDRCSCCTKSPQILVQGINDIPTTAPWMIKYFQGGYDEAKKYTCSSSFKIYPICPDCGDVKSISMTINNLYKKKSISCICGDGFSYPEKFMYNILKQLNVEFKTQYSPDYLNKKRSDFYILSLNLVIETDGMIGHKDGKVHTRSNKTLKECIEADNWKDEQHLKHGIKTIRINCFESNMEYIRENILNSELVDYCDLSNIDWDKADEFAWFSNLRKEVCDYWNNRSELETTTDLGKIFGISSVAIRKYIIFGTELGWCFYNGSEEKTKGRIKSGNMIKSNVSKPVEIFKDNISLGIFESATELERQSEKLFGVHMNRKSISNFCNQIYNTVNYKGYTFKYA